MNAPAGKSHDLRMVRLSDDDHLPSLLLRLRHQLLNVDHVGTGGVHAADAPGRQSVQYAFQFSVRPDHHRIPRRQRFRAVCFPDAPGRQVIDHMGVVDEVSQHPAALGLLCCFLGQLHGPLYAVAKTGAFRQDHLHSGAPPTCCPPKA